MNKKGFENKIEGFSKISKEEKIKWIEKNYFNGVSNPILKNYWNKDDSLQKIHDEFTENTLSNFYLPLGVAPNFLIDNKDYTIPMVIEESSVKATSVIDKRFGISKVLYIELSDTTFLPFNIRFIVCNFNFIKF